MSTPLLAIDTATGRVRRYVYRSFGGVAPRLDMSDEALLQPPLDSTVLHELEAFRVPTHKHVNVPQRAA